MYIDNISHFKMKYYNYMHLHCHILNYLLQTAALHHAQLWSILSITKMLDTAALNDCS